jgi:enoyl-CoA hydratase
MATRTRLNIDDRTAWITLDDGKVNVMSLDMLDEIAARLDETRDHAVTVLAGRPGIFSAGFDLKTFQRSAAESTRMVEAGVRLIEKMLAHPRPIITACTGHAYPMGAFLMLLADVRYGVSGRWNIGMNEVAIGLTLPLFAIELARHRLTGPGYARVTSGALFDPDGARAAGYLDYVVDATHLDESVSEAAQQLYALDPASYVATKARVNAPLIRAIGAAWAAESSRTWGRAE